jgi:chitinase
MNKTWEIQLGSPSRFDAASTGTADAARFVSNQTNKVTAALAGINHSL